MNNLTPYEIHNISYDISNFMYQLHTIPYTKDKIFSVNNIGVKLVDFLDELLDSHIPNKNKVFWKYDEFKRKKQNTLVHGDLNSSNILLDQNNNLTAIIDFGFGGFGNPYFDISRIIGRCPESFRDEIINSYEEISQSKIDKNILNSEVDIWKKIDESYIEYMRSIGIYQ